MTRVGSIVLAAIWFCGCAAILANWLGRWRRVAAAVRAASPVEHGRDLDALRRLEAIAGITRPIPLVSSNIAIEPGVFGIVTPVLLWPHSIAEHLDEGQVEAILAHELCHVRRRDNLAAAAHMFVEAVFWFHPLVWWLGTRLVDERERACDAEVVRMGSEPQVYAESILKICQFYVQSPLVCVAGVTGSSLKKRIEQIMRNDPGRKLNAFKKLLLATAGVAAIAGPVVIGVLNTPRLRAQSSAEALGPPFATVSVKVNTSDDPQFYQPTWTPDGTFTWKNIRLRNVILNSYQGVEPSRLSGGPDWLRTDRFDIEAKADGDVPREQRAAMLRRLLADTFQLVLRHETRQLPIYAIVLAKSDGTLGPNLRPSTPECIAAADALHSGKAPLPPALLVPRTGPPEPSQVPCGTISARPQGTMTARAATMADMARGMFGPMLGRVVVDRTGLTGYYDFDLEYAPAVPPGPPPTPSPAPAYGRPAPSIGPAFFKALQEQLGLQLDDQTGPVDNLVIDHVEKPAGQ